MLPAGTLISSWLIQLFVVCVSYLLAISIRADTSYSETRELWAWNVQTRPDNPDGRYKEILREAYDEKNYPLYFNKLLAQLCDSFATCTGNVNEDFVLGCLKNGLEATMLQTEDTATLMAGRVKGKIFIEIMFNIDCILTGGLRIDYINQLVSSESTKKDELDDLRDGQMNDQSGSKGNQRDNQDPS